MKTIRLQVGNIFNKVIKSTLRRSISANSTINHIKTYKSISFNNRMGQQLEATVEESKTQVQPEVVQVEGEQKVDTVQIVQPKVKKQKVKKLKPIPIDINLLFDLQTLNSKFIRNEANEPFRKSLFYSYLPFKLYDEVEVTILKIASSGVGIGQTDPSIDWYILVPFTSVGDKVMCRVYSHSLGYSEADLISIVEPSLQNRIEPKCKYANSCSGCQWQHLDLNYQIQLKALQIKRCFLYFARPLYQYLIFDSVCESPLTFQYRTKLTPHFDRPKVGKELNIGFMEKGRKRIIDIESCILATEEVQQGYDEERIRVLNDRASFKNGATLIIRQNEIEGEGEGKKLSYVVKSKDSVHQTVGKFKFIYPAGSFFQINASILPLLCDYVRSQLTVHQPKYLLDAYCGSGLFAVTCHQSFTKVYGIDINDQSIACASNNASINGITNVEFTLGTASNIFAKLDIPGDSTGVIIDPPRKGCDTAFLTQLVQLKPKVIVYVSCNPFSQARDILELINLCGGYSTMKAIGLDQFRTDTQDFDDITANSPKGIDYQLVDQFFKAEDVEAHWDSLHNGMDRDIKKDYKKFLGLSTPPNLENTTQVEVQLEESTKAEKPKGAFTYKVTNIRPFDMFPMTMHIESVVTLVRVDL